MMTESDEEKMSTPVTDGEQWSDDTELSGDDATPEDEGYVPLPQYQPFGDDDGEEEEHSVSAAIETISLGEQEDGVNYATRSQNVEDDHEDVS